MGCAVNDVNSFAWVTINNGFGSQVLVVNLDTLVQASNFRIERRQSVFLCGMQDSNPWGHWKQNSSRLNTSWRTDWAIKDQAVKLELDSPFLSSASIQPIRPHCRSAFAFASGFGARLVFVVNFDALAQSIDFLFERTQVVFHKLNAGFEAGKSRPTIHTYIYIYMHTLTHIYIYVFRCWSQCSRTGKRFSNWRETICLLLLNAGFENEGPRRAADWMPTDKPTELSSMKLKPSSSSYFISRRIHKTYAQHYNNNFTTCNPLAIAREAQRLIELTTERLIELATWYRQSVPMFTIIKHTRSHCRLAFAPGPTYVHTYIHTYMHACIHTYINTYMNTYIHACMHTYIHTYLLLLISMLWHRQAIFESKGDKLSSPAESRIRTQGVSET